MNGHFLPSKVCLQHLKLLNKRFLQRKFTYFCHYNEVISEVLLLILKPYRVKNFVMVKNKFY